MSKKSKTKSSSKKQPDKFHTRSETRSDRVMVLCKKGGIVLRGVLLLIPIVFFVMLEFVLFIFNYGTDLSLFKTFAAHPKYYTINPNLGLRYFPSQHVKPDIAHTDAFLKKKPAQGVRIFTLGGSTAAGFPYEYNASFSSILKVILKAYYPQKPIDVINLAMPAVSSYAVRDIGLELAEYEPDLILIYSGHNEFYGGLGVASTESLGHSRWLTRLYLSLQQYKTFQLVRDGIRAARNLFSEQKIESSTALMEHVARNRYIPYGRSLYFKAGEIFEENIGDVSKYCRENNIPVFIGNLVSNIRHHPPFVDVFENEDSEIRWKNQFKAAESTFAKKEYLKVLRELNRCSEIDSLPASQYYLKGETYLALGDTSKGYQAFYRAKEFDGLRFRASEDLNDRLLRIGQAENVYLVPIKEVFELASPGHLPGNNLILEHLHPNLQGYILMAKTFAKAILQTGFIGSPITESLPDSIWIRKIGVTEADLEIANYRISLLMQGWPFVTVTNIHEKGLNVSDTSSIQKLARQFCKGEITWEEMHVQAAEYYNQQRIWEKAELEYRALIRATPMNYSPYIYLGRALLSQKKLEEALEIFRESLVIEPSAFAYKMTGTIFMMRQEVDSAIIHFEKALQKSPNDTDALFQLAQAYAVKGDFKKANPVIQKAIRLKGDDPDINKLAMYIEWQMNNQDTKQ